MKTNRDMIIDTSLKLFANKGFSAVSTDMIAKEIGITKGALYRHFDSKQAILDAIIEKMYALDHQQAADAGVPVENKEVSEYGYDTITISGLVSFVINQFDFWTVEGFPMCFRKMLTIEQFGSEKMNTLYQQTIGYGPVKYTAEIIKGLIERKELNVKSKARGEYALAIELFAPLNLCIQLADGGRDKSELKNLLTTIIKNIEREWTE